MRLIRKWVTAGVVENGHKTDPGRYPDRAVISPLLANIYLHYVFVVVLLFIAALHITLSLIEQGEVTLR